MPLHGTEWADRYGTPTPLGATWLSEREAWNFSLVSRHAQRVELLLFREDEPGTPALIREMAFPDNKSGHFWHCRVAAAEAPGAFAYAYRVDGDNVGHDAGWNRFDPLKLLLDPYAKAVWFPPGYDREAARHAGANAGKAMLGVLPSPGGELLEPFDWQGVESPRHGADLVFYELHLRGFTAHPSSGLSRETRGTYLGLIEKIPYLRDLGVTAVELMPVFQYDSSDGNYWGYSPVGFFAPHAQYGSGASPTAHVAELKTMVRELHRAGIEVILDVVFNHTGEGGADGPTFGFRGIDNASYYLQSADREEAYFDVTGTGNTVAINDRFVRRMIVDSLLHWVGEYHIDGFRFDLAAVKARNPDGSLNLTDPPIVGDIMAAPGLQGVRMIEEPWDAAGVKQLGLNNPNRMGMQWNDEYRDCVRRFVRGDGGNTRELADRIAGSPDLFPPTLEYAKRPFQSVNIVTCHDGFTLYDLVSYSHKHNLANGEDNRDGLGENYSSNHGIEGDEGLTKEIRLLRERQARNYHAILMLSAGTPLLLAGDEGLRTQGGNNNTWNQDNELGWIDWGRLEANASHREFLKRLLALRNAFPTLVRPTYWGGDASWYGLDGPQRFFDEDRALALRLTGRDGESDLYLCLNAHSEPLPFTVQGEARRWRIALDTSGGTPEVQVPGADGPFTRSPIEVAGRSVVLLIGSSA
ncbi:MAG: isoamylase [Planctomycetota bacterium]